MSLVKIIKKQKHQGGVNTYYNNGIVISSMKYTNGKTTYNIYWGGCLDDDNILDEDIDISYQKLNKEILNLKFDYNSYESYKNM